MLSIRNFSGQLSVIKTTDEDLNVSYTFTDEMGHVVLTRQMKGSETHDTYYVYDDKSNLCFVLQPMYQSSANLDLYAFQYKYDGRNRCIWKKLPGAGYMEMVYDNADRLVFSQDGNQRALTSGNWTYYKYDGLNRLTEQGVCTNKVTTSGTTVHIRNYYDSYSFIGTQGFPAGKFNNDTSGYSKGLLTGQMVAGLGTSGPVWKAYYYDIRGREVKRVESNVMSGYDVTTTTYSFTDKPLTVTHTQSAGSTGSTSLTEVTTYAYDSADRLQKVQHKLDSGPTVTLAEYGYDNFGRLNSKKLGGTLHTSTYAYNLRSWLTGISGSKFSQTLTYNNGSAGYNGNITAMDWTANGSSHRYTFAYDGLNRLTAATHGAGQYTEKVTGYDKNGNILSLQRYGQTSASAYGLIDNLTFTLVGNRPTRVDDAVAASAYNGGFEFKDGVKQANEYTYDANGNLTKDLNKGISSIQYNILNLPVNITFASGGFVQYGYTADGIKRRMMYKEANNPDAPVNTVYCSNVIYEGSVAKLLLTEEGYVTLSDKKYHYYLQDHQGNNRVVLSSSGTVEEVNHYYSFGGVFASSGNVQPYKYNGKEYDGKKGLNWYDYGARMYDAALGRFMTVDPLAEKYYPMSPYGYCLNNPIKFIDADGRLPRIYIERKGFGHAFVTVGNGDNTIVYTYGRYGESGKDKSSARNTSPTGEGVLIKLTGRDAISFIQDQMLANEAVGYEFTKGSDELVSKHFDKQLDNSNKIPQKGKYAGKENAKVIDEYNLFINNCATTSIKGIQEGVKKDLDLKDSKAPASLGDRLKVMSKEDEHSIRRITYNEIKKEFNLHGAGTKW
ncbi:RHS repeat-associated core domain [Bacteroides uniformis]|uniref:RHS repeat-associated core domain n=1 Tax=Bacteroides uniformis TaxID=820 RepID=A0A174NZ17_BACUN|nr:RHS repeat-associated core domain-containing protein [Bacteroides uniformis]CUP51245.1 RHS repeat-associated core domain [Bacteroides uniformis]